MDWIQLA